MQVDRLAFREAMARLGAGVAVVTTDGVAGRCGFTCTALCSVSDEPATVLVCLSRRSQMNSVVKQNGVFCVNVLSASQQMLSSMFAGQLGVDMRDRFDAVSWRSLATGAPALVHGLRLLDCRIVDLKEVGTHTVMFGQVLALTINEEADCLIYANRKYRAMSKEVNCLLN